MEAKKSRAGLCCRRGISASPVSKVRSGLLCMREGTGLERVIGTNGAEL